MPTEEPLELSIIHLSDIHFNAKDKHRFPWKLTSGDDNPEYQKLPNLYHILKKDLESIVGTAKNVLLICSGDFTQTNDEVEFDKAKQFLTDMVGVKVGATTIQKKNIFLVPGNHDVNYKLDPADPERWKQFYKFYTEFFGSERKVAALGVEKFTRVINRMDDINTIILEVNTSWFVKEGEESSNRGQVEQSEIKKIRDELNNLSKDAKFANAAKIAIMHHHPVLIPAFAELGKKYDAIENGPLLLKELRKHGFQLITHGHKHNPHTFNYDPLCAWENIDNVSFFIVAGGSVSSSEIANHGANTYNIIDVKRDPGRKDTIIQVETRKLEMVDKKTNEALALDEWSFSELRYRRSAVGKREDNVVLSDSLHKFDPKNGLHAALLDERSKTLARLRGNLPIAEVRQTFATRQRYEAFLKIAANANEQFPREMPVSVDWFMGSEVENVASCSAGAAGEFRTKFEFKGSGHMVLARINFATDKPPHSKKEEIAYVYASPPTINP